MNKTELLQQINGRGKFSVVDDEYGQSTVEVESVNGTTVNWRLYNAKIASESVAYQNDSLEGLIWYLQSAQAKIHWTVNA